LIIVNEVTYVKKFVVSVVDAAGVAKPDVNLVVSVDLPQYRKGSYAVPLFGDTWTKTGSLPSGDAAVCANEDTNRNGVLETGEKRERSHSLHRRVVQHPLGSWQVRCQRDASACKDPSRWNGGTAVAVREELSRRGSMPGLRWQRRVSSGTEGRATYLVAPISADAASFKNVDVTPAYVVSPYGRSSNCANPN
jgi:hypothetical protein